LRFTAEVGVADLAAAAPAEKRDFVAASAERAGGGDGKAEIARVLLDAPRAHERVVRERAGDRRPAIVDRPDVDAVLGEKYRQRMRAGEECRTEVPDVAVREENHLPRARGDVRRGLAHHAMQTDLVVRTAADAQFVRVLGDVAGERTALDLLCGKRKRQSYREEQQKLFVHEHGSP
jgi:hypothetical protein